MDGAGTVTAVWTDSGPLNGRSTTRAARRVRGQPWTASVTLFEANGLVPAPTGLVAASTSGDVAVLLSNLQSTRWTSSGAERLSAPLGPTMTAQSDIFGLVRPGYPLVVNWSPPETGLPVTGYRLEAGTSPGATDLAVVDVGTATRLNASVPAARRFGVRVRALNGATAGPPSNPFYIDVCGAPLAPSGLTHTVSGSTVTLTWSPGSADMTYPYVLEAGTAAGLANLVSQDIGGAIRFSATAPPGTCYVRVRATSICDRSEPSNEVVVTIGGAPRRVHRC